MKISKDFNSCTYRLILENILMNQAENNMHDIAYEVNAKRFTFNPDDKIDCASDKYIQAEFNWYMSEDLCITGHELIENNKIWSTICSDDKHINSNYGWCVLSKANGKQFDNALKHLSDDISTKHACMYYTRPSIHKEYNDNKHAKYDMLCTIYTNHIIRFNKLNTIVHMRSSDAWNGIRNDLAWHQFVYNRLYNKLKMQYTDLYKGDIIFIVDSLHIYKRDVDKIKKYLKEANNDTRS